jgi:hypothetical protein
MPNSTMTGTVRPFFAIPQYDQRDTYSITMGGNIR